MFRTFLLNILSQLLKLQGLKYIFVLFELKHTEFFTYLGGYLISITLYVPGVGFSIAGLDLAKFGFYRFRSVLFIDIIVISILLKTAFCQTSSSWSATGENFVAIGQG